MRAAFQTSTKPAAALDAAAAADTPALLINLKAACDSPGKHSLGGGEHRLGSRRLQVLSPYSSSGGSPELQRGVRMKRTADVLMCSLSLEVRIRTRL